MEAIADIEKRYKVGLMVLSELFKLSDVELKKKLISVCGELPSKDLLDNESTTIRTIRNENPDKIEIWFYDHLEVSPFGISYCPEHGERKQIVQFNDHFKL